VFVSPGKPWQWFTGGCRVRW